MSKENQKTVEVYEKKANVYLETGIIHDNIDPEKAKRKREKLQKFIKESLESLPEKSKVFEIGSADGKNAKYIESLGYTVTASDLAEAFLNAIKKQNLEPVKFNVLEDEFPEKYSAIFAWRVFVHFNTEDMTKVLPKVYDALEKDGLFIFNVMNREIRTVDEEWVDFSNEYNMGAERYYKYFDEKELNKIISETGYQIYKFHKEGGDANNKWLVYVLKK